MATIIWGTYRTLRDTLDCYNKKKTLIPTTLCTTIIEYLDYLKLDNNYTEKEIADIIRHMIKKGFKPYWFLPWRGINSTMNYYDIGQLKNYPH